MLLTYHTVHFFCEAAVDSIMVLGSVLAQDSICIVSVAKGFGKVCPTISVYSTGLSRQCKLVVSLSCDNT